MTTLNTIIEEEKEWKCIGHTEYGDKISLDGHSYIEVPTDYIKQVRREERAKVRKEVIEEVFEVEKEKWNDAVHCTCLGYALVKLAGGEDSEGGKKMEERLLKLTPDYKDKTGV